MKLAHRLSCTLSFAAFIALSLGCTAGVDDAGASAATSAATGGPAARVVQGRIVVDSDDGLVELSTVAEPLQVGSRVVVLVRPDLTLVQAELRIRESTPERVVAEVVPFEGAPARPEDDAAVVERALRSAVTHLKTAARPDTDCDEGLEALVRRLGCADLAVPGSELRRSPCGSHVREKDLQKIRTCHLSIASRPDMSCAPRVEDSIERAAYDRCAELGRALEECPAVARDARQGWSACCVAAAGAGDCSPSS